MNKFNISIAGAGFGKNVHLAALQSSEYLNPISFYHPDKSKSKEIQHQTGLKCFNNWETVINQKNIDGIIIATPPGVRYELAKEALLNKKHILLEKPVALHSYEIEELLRISLKNNLSVCVDFEYRAVPLFMQTKKILDSNILGNIYLIKLDWLMGSRADPRRNWNWYSQSEMGGGIIGALGTHAIDIIHWFFGEIKKVSAINSISIKERPNCKNNELIKVTSEDVCLANMDINNFNNSTIPCQLSLSSIAKNGRGFSLEIYGSEGSLVLSSSNQKDYVHGFTLSHCSNSNKIQNINASDEYGFERTWADGRIAPVKRIHDKWAKSIKNNTPVIPGLSEGLLSQVVCEGIKDSSRSGLSIDF